MTRGLLFALVLASPVARADAAPSVNTALPRGAHVLSALQVSGYPGRYAVAYQTKVPYLGVVVTGASSAREVWHRRLPAAPTSLKLPGPAGVFYAEAKTPDAVTHLFVYRLKGSGVSSAIEGNSRAELTGDDGIKVVANGFRLLNHDAAHAGSVPYRVRVPYSWDGTGYVAGTATRVPDFPVAQYPVPNGVVHTASGDTILIRLEIADTEQKRETGLMNVKTLDPDTGMAFVWPGLVHESFWMENTYIPLTVAFLAADGTIQETQDMQPLTVDYHTPVAAYRYAIEANLGFFAANGIRVGDKVDLHLTPSGGSK